MKKLLLTIIILVFVHIASGQTIKRLFLKLPNECTPEINEKEKQILLQKGEYVIPGGDSIETVEYNVEETTKDFLRVEQSFTTGQRAFLAIELRIFKKSNGDTILIYSRYGGVPAFFNQQALLTFNIKNGKLIDNKENLLPDTVDLMNFIKKGTPDSIITQIRQAACTSYCLDTSYCLNTKSSKIVEYELLFGGGEDEVDKWLTTNTVEFTWNGISFSKEFIKQ